MSLRSPAPPLLSFFRSVESGLPEIIDPELWNASPGDILTALEKGIFFRGIDPEKEKIRLVSYNFSLPFFYRASPLELPEICQAQIKSQDHGGNYGAVGSNPALQYVHPRERLADLIDMLVGVLDGVYVKCPVVVCIKGDIRNGRYR